MKFGRLRQALEALDVYREYDPDGGGVADKVAAALRERLGEQDCAAAIRAMKEHANGTD